MAVFVKDPDAVLDFGVEWVDWLEDGETITSSTWSVSPSGLTLGEETFNGHATVVWTSGGSEGTTYALTNRVTTSDGRTDDRTLYIRIKNR